MRTQKEKDDAKKKAYLLLEKLGKELFFSIEKSKKLTQNKKIKQLRIRDKGCFDSLEKKIEEKHKE